MNKKLDKKLCKDFPKIFADRHKSMKETCMCWGFSHGDGWYDLINLLCKNIQFRIDSHNEYIYKPNLKHRIKRYFKDILLAIQGKETSKRYGETKMPQVVASQVKEKFGTLRFYYSGGDDEIDGMVSFAEYLSGYICEQCGKFDPKGTTRSEGCWVYNSCDDCWKGIQAERERRFKELKKRSPHLFKKKTRREK